MPGAVGAAAAIPAVPFGHQVQRPIDDDACLLTQLAAHRVLERLAGLHMPGGAGKSWRILAALKDEEIEGGQAAHTPHDNANGGVIAGVSDQLQSRRCRCLLLLLLVHWLVSLLLC